MSHLWLGLLSSIIIVVVCLSGSIYAFKNQIEDSFNHKHLYVSSIEHPKVQADTLLSLFEEKYGAATSIRIFPEPDRSILISSFSRESPGVSAYFDPYTGDELGRKNANVESFFAFILDLHRFLLAGDVGKFINGTAVLIFTYMLLSGFILWLPKKVKKLGSRMLVRWRARFYRLNYDLHSVLGFYSFLLLFFMAVTGLYVSFTWVKNAVIIGLGGDSIIISENNTALKESLSNAFDSVLKELSNEQQENQQSAQWTLQGVLAQADSALPAQGAVTIYLPNENLKEINLTQMRHDNWLHFHVPDQIEFSSSGQLRKVSTFYDQLLHEQFKLIAKPLHTGEIMGLPSIILYFIVSTIGCSLPITGFIIWWKKT